MDDRKHEGVLSRWSQRKRAVASQEKPAGAKEHTAVDSDRDAQLLANREAAEAIDLETLNADSDFTIFMKEGVPDILRKKALSVLWRSNPVLANLDGLNDYDEDFARPDMIMKTFQSAWQAGRGYLAHAEKDKAKEAAKSEGTAGEDPMSADQPASNEDERDICQEDEENAAPKAAAKPVEADAFDDEQPDDDHADPAMRVSLRQRLMLDNDAQG